MTDNREARSTIFNAEMIVALSAVVIGACALILAFFEVRIMRADQRASVLPVLELSRSYSWSNREEGGEAPVARLMLSAENVGTGPAKVIDFHVTVDGQAYKTWGSAIHALIDENVEYGESTILGRTIPPGRTVWMFTLGKPEYASQIYAAFDRLNFEACFCSLYDECWTTSYRRFGTTEPTDACRPGSDSFQE